MMYTNVSCENIVRHCTPLAYNCFHADLPGLVFYYYEFLVEWVIYMQHCAPKCPLDSVAIYLLSK